jgi:hypothetical protein
MVTGNSLAQAPSNSTDSTARPVRAASTTGQSERSAAATATAPQPEGSTRSAVPSAGDVPAASCWPITVANDQPPEASAMTTAMSSPPSSWPRRELMVAARPAATTRDSSTTITSSSSAAGTAARTGSTPNWAAVRGRTAKATRVTAGATPAKEAPSRPVASRRGGIGTSANHSGRRPTPAPRTRIGPMTQPISQPSISAATRSTDRLGSLNWIRPHSSVATASPSPMIRKATTVPDPPPAINPSSPRGAASRPRAVLLSPVRPGRAWRRRGRPRPRSRRCPG